MYTCIICMLLYIQTISYRTVYTYVTIFKLLYTHPLPVKLVPYSYSDWTNLTGGGGGVYIIAYIYTLLYTYSCIHSTCSIDVV